MRRRVVITGLGCVSPLGCNVKSAWTRLIAGEVSTSRLEDNEYNIKLPCKVVAKVDKEQLNIEKYISKSEMRSMSLATIYGLIASDEAWNDSKLNNVEDRSNIGVCVGTGMVDLDSICDSFVNLKKGYSKVSPFFVPKILPNMTAGFISIKYGLRGPVHTVSTACATGCHAIGDAFKFIQNDMANIILAGGTEACITPLAVAGFCRLRALSTNFNDHPQKASRPFDKSRDGFIMGEGSAVLVLEELEHAKSRGCHIYGEILGYGLSGDASHITAPHEEGVGAYLAMLRSLKDAKLTANEISYINCHATSTPLGDAIELQAIKRIFQNKINQIAISSTKGSHGHLLGAAGNLETLFTLLSICNSKLPPTVNLSEPCDEAKDINCVPNVAQNWPNTNRKIALKNSFGFGGTNACLCIGEYSN